MADVTTVHTGVRFAPFASFLMIDKCRFRLEILGTFCTYKGIDVVLPVYPRVIF